MLLWIIFYERVKKSEEMSEVWLDNRICKNLYLLAVNNIDDITDSEGSNF